MGISQVRSECALLRNSQTAFALLVLLLPTISLCQVIATEPSSQESQPAQTLTPPLPQPEIPSPMPPQKSPPKTPTSVIIIDPNLAILHQTHRIMGILPNFTAVDSNTQ